LVIANNAQSAKPVPVSPKRGIMQLANIHPNQAAAASGWSVEFGVRKQYSEKIARNPALLNTTFSMCGKYEGHMYASKTR